MSNIVPFKLKSRTKIPTKSKLDCLLEFLHNMIVGDTLSREVMMLDMGNVTAKVQWLNQSYEEERLKCFIANTIMVSPGLQSMIMLTPHISRKEMVDVACIEVSMWTCIPHHISYFTTAHNGGFEYNFRTANHDIAQIKIRLNVYD